MRGLFSLLDFLVYWLAIQENHKRAPSPIGSSAFGPEDAPGLVSADALAITPAVFDFQIEECLPQVGCLYSRVLDAEQRSDNQPEQIATLLASTKVDGPPEITRRNRWIEQQVIEKCTSNVHLGLKTYWLLKAALGHLDVPTKRGLPQITGERQRAHLMSLLSSGERMAKEGRGSPHCLAPLRARYFSHCTNFAQALVKLSYDVKSVSILRRLTALHQGIDRINNLLFRVMHTRGEEMDLLLDVSAPGTPGSAGTTPPSFFGAMGGGTDGSLRGGGLERGGSGTSWLNEEHIARQCPEVASFSVHLPLLDGANPVFRFLRLVSGECELLPSRERCPYLVVAEMLQTERNTRCGSAKLYTNGASVGCSVRDVLDRRQFPESLLYADDHPVIRYPVQPVKFNNDYENDEDYFLDLHANHGSLDHDLDLDPPGLDPRIRRALTVRKVFGELWQWKEQRIRNSSPFGRLAGWRLAMFIVKAGDDLRQEQVAMQVISLLREIYRAESLDVWLRPYVILCVGNQAGLIEAVADAKSIDHIKKKAPHFTGLREYYERVYGFAPYSRTFREAQRNFIQSLAGYCVVTYLLQVKDRHNANILIDKQGHLIHIDFGFMLGATPGSVSFEKAPFKLTREYVELMGGLQDPNHRLFCELVIRAFQVLNKPQHRARLLNLIAVSISDAPGKQDIVKAFAERLAWAGLRENAEILIAESYDNPRSRWYDLYQKKVNGIAA